MSGLPSSFSLGKFKYEFIHKHVAILHPNPFYGRFKSHPHINPLPPPTPLSRALKITPPPRLREPQWAPMRANVRAQLWPSFGLRVLTLSRRRQSTIFALLSLYLPFVFLFSFPIILFYVPSYPFLYKKACPSVRVCRYRRNLWFAAIRIMWSESPTAYSALF